MKEEEIQTTYNNMPKKEISTVNIYESCSTSSKNEITTLPTYNSLLKTSIIEQTIIPTYNFYNNTTQIDNLTYNIFESLIETSKIEQTTIPTNEYYNDSSKIEITILPTYNNLFKTSIIEKSLSPNYEHYNNTTQIENLSFNEFESYFSSSNTEQIILQTYESYYTQTKIEITTLPTLKTESSKISTAEIKTFNAENTHIETSELDIIKIDYFENSNLTSSEINKKIYEQVINILTKNFEQLGGKEKIIEGKDNYFYQFTTSDNEINNLKGNSTNKFSKIDLGECENILKEKNNINKNLSLLIIKYEKLCNNPSERNLQYEVYDPINKTRLDLSVCKEVSIDIYVPIILSEKIDNLYNELKDLGYDLFDINCGFYQDICTPYKSENGTDVLLSDRINYYFNNEETQCQPNCEFSDFSMESQNLKCECNIENGIINFEESKTADSKSIYKSFYDVLKYSNYKVLKCYKLVFSSTIFKSNKGNIISLIFFAIYIITLITYFIKGIEELKRDLSEKLIDIKPNFVNNPKLININININMDKELKINKNSSELKNNTNNKKNDKILILKKTLKKRRRSQPIIIFDYPPKKNLVLKSDIKYNNNSLNNNCKSQKIIEDSYSKREMNEIKIMQKIITENLTTKNEEKLDSYELNNLNYDIAINLDKRKFLEIYWSFLKREHLIIFTFFIRNDHNIKYVKYSRFIFLIFTDMALNVFFFSDETMHKMFIDYGKYNFFQQIPQIIYSTIVSQIIEVLLCFLSLTDKYYYKAKELNIKSRNNILRIIKFIQFKIYFFYIFTGFLFLFFWYTKTSFCAVYENTQSAFIKDSFLSFALGLLYPFAIYLIPSILRLLSLRCCKGKLSFIYKLSDLIPFF